MKDKKTDDLMYPENTDFAAAPDEFETAEEYLGFVSNGMTNNEKIDELDRKLDQLIYLQKTAQEMALQGYEVPATENTEEENHGNNKDH